ncbi:MAG: potassium ABC transporter ATPase [Dethiosulfovibrio peptidovorans]|nr:MAG: potassium ABC transporter ATPase [Dethiosulfovibrio peptidovorans]
MKPGNKTILRQFFPESIASQILELSSATVSLSGGVDSSAVLALLAGVMPQGSLRAVIFDSFLHPQEERERAEILSRALDVPYILITGPEMSAPLVVSNHEDRCAICKELRIQALIHFCETEGIATLVDGTNADDLRDPTRAGNRVLARYPVFSPLALAGLSKAGVRALARELEIPWWNSSATACLATRFPVGSELDPQEAQKVGNAERDLQNAGFDVRLRAWAGAVCLEFPPEIGETQIVPRGRILEILSPYDFHRIMVDLEGYRTGRVWP